jgi:ubiquinone biosynthesis protein
LLSTRPDIVADDLRLELAKLQDDVAPIEGAAIVAALEAHLGGPVDRFFAEFDLTPVASASIGQIHAALLHDGTPAIVKVRKPEVDRRVLDDVEIIRRIAKTVEQHWEFARTLGIAELAEEFCETLIAELDYTREGHNVDRMARKFEKSSGLAFPEVFWDCCGPGVLTMARLDGAKPDAVRLATLSQTARAKGARAIARFTLEGIFLHGFFHADPHPGNLAMESDGTVDVMDFGMVGSLPATLRRVLGNLCIAIERGDAERLTDAFLAVTASAEPVDRMQIRTELERLTRQFYDESLERTSLTPIVLELFAVARRHRLHLPSNAAMALRAVMLAESTVALCDPAVGIADSLGPLARKLMRARLSPENIKDRAFETSLDAADLAIELPLRVNRLLGDIEAGRMRVWVKADGLDEAMNKMEKLLARSNAATLTAAFIVGLAILTLVYRPTGWQTWAGPVFAVAAAGALIVGFYLLFVTLRSLRK